MNLYLLRLAAMAGLSFASATLVSGASAPARLGPHDATPAARIGAAVAIDDDVIVIGAPDDSATAPLAGSAYVYTRRGQSWAQQTKLSGPATSGYRSFGEAVGVSGNVIIVGAPFENGPAGPASGAAYVYARSAQNWTLQTKLTPTDAAENQQFGDAVAIDGDTIVVGAFLDSGRKTNAGAAYVFKRIGGKWEQRAKLTASDATSFAFFGSAVAIDGDTIVVGAPTAEAAYVFTENHRRWMERGRLKASDDVATDYSAFGASVAVDHRVVVVGAPLAGKLKARAGAVYVFEHKHHGWSTREKLTAADAGVEDEFGSAVAIEHHTIAVGSPYAGDANQGAVYVFAEKRKHHSSNSRATVTRTTGSTFLGISVALDSDTAVAGAPAFAEFTAAPAGAAYVIDLR